MISAHSGMAADLESLVDRIQSIIRELEHVDMNEMLSDEPNAARFETARTELHDALGYVIETLATRLLLYAEALNLPLTRGEVLHWRSRWTAERIRESRVWGTSEADGRESIPYNELRGVVDGILAMVSPEHVPAPDPRGRTDLDLLEHCLRSLAKICRERGVAPHSEHELQAVLHSHLEAVFDDYTRSVTISKPLVSFKPDGGVVSLRAAIECKFVDSADEARVAIHGLTEDLSGYAGSSDWVHFYSVVYMTGPYATEGQFQRALGLSGNAGAWKTVLVTGEGSRGRSTKAAKSPLSTGV